MCAFLSACATSSQPLAINADMPCSEVMEEIDKTRATLYNEKTTKKSAAPAVAGTAADVAVIGAGMAGIPYVGGIYSIGRTIFNHTKKTSVDQTDLYQARLNELEYIAERNQCNL